jgi:hypothetical protein
MVSILSTWCVRSIAGTRPSPTTYFGLKSWNRLSTAAMSLAGESTAVSRALWKLSWFLRDFGYDPELLGRDELDESGVCGLTGVVRIVHKNFDGRSLLSLEAFAPADRWPEICGSESTNREVA